MSFSFNSLAIISLALILSYCRNHSSVTESASDSQVMSATSSLTTKSILLNQAFIIDFSAEIHSSRVNRIASEAMAGPSRMIVGAQSQALSPVQSQNGGCQFRVQDRQDPITVEDQEALPLPEGRVVYCNRGLLSWAEVDTEAPKLLLKIGLTANELSGVNFYRVPSRITNAFATLTELNIPVVVIYDGLSEFARANAIETNSFLAGVLAHEFGHIVDKRKKGFTNIDSSRARVAAECFQRLEGTVPNSKAYDIRVESCKRALGADSRSAEYSADNFAAELFGRKKHPAEIKPAEMAKAFRLLGSGHYDPLVSHPDGTERAIQFERSLQRLGVTTETNVDRTHK